MCVRHSNRPGFNEWIEWIRATATRFFLGCCCCCSLFVFWTAANSFIHLSMLLWMVRLRFLGCFCKFSHDDKPKRVQLSTHMRALHLGWDKQMMKRTKRWTNRLTMAPKNMYTTYEWIMCLCALLASLVYLSMLKRYARVRALHSIFAVLFILFADWIAAACCGFHCGVLHRTGVLLTGIPRAMIVFLFF